MKRECKNSIIKYEFLHVLPSCNGTMAELYEFSMYSLVLQRVFRGVDLDQTSAVELIHHRKVLLTARGLGFLMDLA